MTNLDIIHKKKREQQYIVKPPPLNQDIRGT